MTDERILEALGELEAERSKTREAREAREDVSVGSSPAKARIVAMALAEVRRGEKVAHEAEAETETETAGAAPERSGLVVELRGRPWTVRSIAAIVAIAAAASFMFLGDRGGAPLPRYALEMSGGERDVRSGAAEPAKAVRLAPGGALHVELRPDEPVEGAVAARAYLFDGSRLELWDAVTRVSPEGAVAMEVKLGGALAAETGAHELVLAVGRSVPSEAEILEELRAARKEDHGRWRLFVQPIEIMMAEPRP